MNSNNERVSPSDKIVLGLVGAGGRGTSVILNFHKTCPGVEVKYVCDVDQSRGGRAINELGKAQGFQPKRVEDMRRVFEDSDVDAVIICTPEHWHALAFIWACQAGKDVYIEKNISMTINEGRKMIEAARKYDRIVQCGTQNRSAEFAFSARDYISSGKLGDIVHVKTYCLLSGNKAFNLKPDSPVPEGLNWDMWLGPAPQVPYTVSRHKAPYDWWDYSPGLQMAMTAHVVDLARMAIGDPAQPESVYCSGGRILYEDNREIPDIQAVTYQYDDFPMTCESAVFGNYMTKSSPEIRFGDKFPDWKLSSTRIEVYGTDRMMYLGIMGGGWQVLDEDGEVCDQEYGYFPDENHLRNFIECVRSRKKPNGDILQGHRSASLIHLANLAYRAGNKQLYVDRGTETITNSARARELSKGFYRKPYQLPEVI